MWGAIELYRKGDERKRQYIKDMKTTPVEDAFTFEYFSDLVKNLTDKKSSKGLLTQDQLIPGLGNAIAQDILFTARLDPRHPVETLDKRQLRRLYNAIIRGSIGLSRKVVDTMNTICTMIRENTNAQWIKTQQDVHVRSAGLLLRRYSISAVRVISVHNASTDLGPYGVPGKHVMNHSFVPVLNSMPFPYVYNIEEHKHDWR